MIPQIDNSIDDSNLVNEVILPSRTYRLNSNYETQIKYGDSQNVVGETIYLSDAAEIKLKKLDIFGNLKQDGTPSPETSVDINVVKGNNEIYISNKNFFDINNYIPDNTQSRISIEDNYITYNGDNTSGTSNLFTNFFLSCLKGITKGQKYYLIVEIKNVSGTGTIYFNHYNASTFETQFATNIRTTLSNLQSNKKYIYEMVANTNNITAQGIRSYLQLNEGQKGSLTCRYSILKEKPLDISNYTYIPYQSQKFTLDLPVNNLFDGILENSGFQATGLNFEGNTKRIRSKNYTKVKENQTYTINVTEYNTTKGTISIGISYYDKNDYTTARLSESGWKTVPYTFTTPQNCKFIRFLFKITSSSGDSEIVYTDVNKVQLEQGSKANAYTPYGTNPIELCKIGNYQDYFYKSGSKWYLHKEINKDVIDENSNIVIANTNTSNWYYRINPKQVVSTASQTNQFCNYYPNAEIFNGNTNQGILKITSGAEIRIRYGSEGTVANFKDWLASNNIIIYTILGTATDTEITSTTLINQLNNLKKAKAYQNITNIFSMNEVGPILDIDYYPLSSIYYETVQVDRISGFIDDLDAIRQAVYHILSIERYSCLIYDDNYGVELQQYIGQDFEYLKVTIQKTLEEALMQDERIISIDVINVEKIDNETANVKLSIQANVGEIQMEVNVNV